MDAYESGRSGATFKLATWVFVPRMLYPNKAVMTSGDEFNELVTGNVLSKSGPGMFGEGYWNAGWPGLFVVAVVMGLFYWGFERYTEPRLARLQLQYLPVMWIGIFPAIRQDSWFVAETLGIVPIAIFFHCLGRLLASGFAAFFSATLRSRRPAVQ